jgi:hypothetical protein
MRAPKRKNSKRAKRETQRGPRGRVGPQGRVGRSGNVGPAGPPGPAGRNHVTEIERINRELEVQLVRIGQLQAELDRVQAAFREMQMVVRTAAMRRHWEEARDDKARDEEARD